MLRPVDSGEENLIGRRIGRLGTGFYASRDYAARRRLPERRDEWKGHSVIGFADRASNERLARWSDVITRQGSVVLRCSSQGDMLAAARAGLGISALSCFVAAAYPDLVRVAPQKLLSVADIWLLAHPDLVELPAVRAVIDFVTACAREDRVSCGAETISRSRLRASSARDNSSTTDAPRRRAADATVPPAAPSAWRSGGSSGPARP